MSSTDQFLRIEINIKPARKPEIQLLREFLVSFNLCSLKIKSGVNLSFIECAGFRLLKFYIMKYYQFPA